MSQEQQQIFPYLQRLLNGAPVEWKPLGEVLTRTRGTKITAAEMKNLHTDGGSIKIFAGGKTTAFVNYGDIPDADVNTNASIIVKSRGIIEFEYYDKPFSHKNEFWAYNSSNNDNINLKYVYYLLKNNEEYFQGLGSRMQMPQISSKDTDNYVIPIPPMEVQERIVEILDKFTELQAELQAELALREKQYIYFRDQLLSFEMLNRGGYSLNDIKHLPLGEVMDTVTDFTAAGSFASNAKNVKYLDFPSYAMLVRTTDLKQSFTNTKNFVYVDEHAFDYLWRVNLDKESIILPNVGNCGEVYYLLPKDLPTKNCVLGPNALLLRSQQVNNRYLYYLFQGINFQKELSKITSSTGQTKFNKTNLKKIIIPIPPMEEQERIVGILDRFETMVHSIKEGLPREIELRRKQYEYFRDQLLTFPKG